MNAKPNNLEILKDDKGNCFSIIIQVSITDYINTVQQAYSNRGGIEGQRDPLRTNTAKRIRKTMIEDLIKGAVLPPVVLGVIVQDQQFTQIEQLNESSFEEMLA